jgi:hypothetical protein
MRLKLVPENENLNERF